MAAVGVEALLYESLVQDLSALLGDAGSQDVHLLVGAQAERVGAHKLLLLSRCERLKARRAQWLEGGAVETLHLEGFEVRTVRSVLKYVYTGKFDLRELDLFGVLALASEWGLPVLKAYCIERLGSTLTVDTVCATLIGARSLLEDYRGGRSGADALLQEIVGKCLAFIETNAWGVLQSEGFLRLPKESVVAIISSSKLSVPEEDVWRAVLRWGQACSGVRVEEMRGWGEEERQMMRDSLEGVLECVRVMDINSEVFAIEVEPTGLLPLEMTLARYRKAAVQGKGGNGTEVPQARSGGMEPFISSKILEGRLDLQMQISEWCEMPAQEWLLLYRGSRNGFHARQFHACCDDKGATVVVVRTPSGCVFGGFTDVSWSSRFKRGKFASSPTAFLFLLASPDDQAPRRFDIKQSAYAINNHPGNGPIFGSGADLSVSSECHQNKDSYSQLPVSYGDSSLPPHLLAGEQYFSVEDYEVFGVQS